MMKIPTYAIVFAAFVLFSFGCNQVKPDANSASEQPLVISPTDSPATGDAREPELSATSDGRIILSWVEKLDEKR